MMAFERGNNFSKSGKTKGFGGGSNYSLRMFFPNERFSLFSVSLSLSYPFYLTHALLEAFGFILFRTNSGLASSPPLEAGMTMDVAFS